MTPWAYDWTIFIMGLGALGVALWFARKRKKASQRGDGFRVLEIGVFGAATGYVLGVSSLVQDLGRARWQFMASGFLVGAALGALATVRWIRRWELAIDREQEPPPLIERWWQARWFLVTFMALSFVIAVFLSGPIGSFFGRLNDLVPATSYVLSGFFVAFGLRTAFWAKRKEQQGSKPLAFPFRKK
jgi:LPXTG-motif cell wall-anchored protein